MKDNELRGLLLQKYYERRREGFHLPTTGDFDGMLSQEDILFVSDQLGQHGLIDWKPLKEGMGTIINGVGRINASGIDVVEGAKPSPIAIKFSQNNITISDSSNVIVGRANTQTVNIQLGKIIEAIDHSSASEGEKEEAKSLLKKFLKHPLVSALVGAAANFRF